MSERQANDVNTKDVSTNDVNAAASIRHDLLPLAKVPLPPSKPVEFTPLPISQTSSAKFHDEVHKSRITSLTGAYCKAQPRAGGIPILEFGKKLEGCHYLYPEVAPQPPTPTSSVGSNHENANSIQKLDLADAYRQALKETVYVYVQEKGKDAFAGSGVVVGQTDSKTFILTANHVVTDESPKLSGRKIKADDSHIVSGRKIKTNDGEVYNAHLLENDAKGDFALLEIDVGKNSKHPLQVASVVKDGASPKPGESIVFAGFPEDTKSMYMSPGLASKSEMERFDENNWLYVLSMLAKGSHGNSGGPVFNAKHQVVGLIEGGSNHDMDALILSKKMVDKWLKPYGITSR